MGFRWLSTSFITLAILHASHTHASLVTRADDPCAVIGGQAWAAPADVRACFKSFPVNETIKANIIDVVSKTFAFHTSTNYEIQAPAPFQDTHEDVLADLQRIKSQSYESDYDLHIDLSHTMRRLNDGHSVYINMCYDQTYTTYLPIPLVLLVDDSGHQDIYIAPEAFNVTQKNFPEQIDTWQNALEGDLKGKLESLSGAKVISINGGDPWTAVDANAAIAGSFQSFATRQNGFFASFALQHSDWRYIMGQFAQTALPLADSVTLTVQRTGSTTTDTVTLPYRSKFGSSSGSVAFTDSASFWANNCLATSSTNGHNINAAASKSESKSTAQGVSAITKRFNVRSTRSILDNGSGEPSPAIDIVSQIVDVNSAPTINIPDNLKPHANYIYAFDEIWTYLLDDNKTAVISVGDYEGNIFSQRANLQGAISILGYYGRNVTRLIVDVSNNPGGALCIAEYHHRYLIGKRPSTYPNSGLDGTVRVNPLAQKIVSNIVTNASTIDSKTQLLYNPTQWTDPTGKAFNATYNWLQSPVPVTVNGKQDSFSQRLGPSCSQWVDDAPTDPKFSPDKIVVLSNGRCASACAVFITAMAKEDNVRVVSIGGKAGTEQQYAGTVGGVSTDYSEIDTEIKTTGLKSDPLAPPDFISNSYQGITFRLGYGVQNKNQPEEWQDRKASLNYQLTKATINNPWAFWTDISKKYFDSN